MVDSVKLDGWCHGVGGLQVALHGAPMMEVIPVTALTGWTTVRPFEVRFAIPLVPTLSSPPCGFIIALSCNPPLLALLYLPYALSV